MIILKFKNKSHIGDCKNITIVLNGSQIFIIHPFFPPDFCQRLSQKENDPDMSDNENEEKADDDTGFIHHPFKVKEATTIKLNIKVNI